jgi:hypothetical protein
MKRFALALIGVLLVTGIGFAQSAAPNAPQTAAPNAASQTQVTKVTGKLELIQGVIGIKSNGKTYLIPKLQRVAGFVKGVEEGGTVTVEGYEYALPYTTDITLLQATKLTVGGKDYDLGQQGMGMMGAKKAGRGMMQGRMGGARGGMMGGRW